MSEAPRETSDEPARSSGAGRSPGSTSAGLAGTSARIAYGTAARLGGRVLGGLVTLIALHYATHWFGPEEWGHITVAIAWISLFAAIGGPGVATLALREIARRDAPRGEVLGSTAVASAVVGLGDALLAVAIAVAVYWSQPDTLVLVAAFAAAAPLNAVFVTSGSGLAGLGRNDLRGLMDVGSSVLLLGATLAVVGERLGATAYAAGYDASLLVSAVVATWIAARRCAPVRLGSHHLVSTIRASVPLGQVDVLASVYARADTLLLFFLKGASPVALYGVAYQVATFVMASPTFFTSAIAPDYMVADTAGRERIVRRSFDVLITVALPVPLFGVVFARPFVVWLAGARFAGAGPLLAILSFAAAATLLDAFLFQIALFAGLEDRIWRSLAVVTAANLVANAVAIPVWGATGAAVAMIVSESVGLAAYSRRFLRAHPEAIDGAQAVAVAAAVILLGAAWALLVSLAHLGPGTRAGIVPRALALAVAYGVLVLLFRRLASWLARVRASSGTVKV